jgi:DNA-binding CsgD family transcriptional regulator
LHPRVFPSTLAGVNAAPGTGFVGRHDEIQMLARLLDDVIRGVASTVLIEGEAGIGKTCLIDWLVDQAGRRGMRIFRGNAHPLERTRPFGAIIDAIGLRVTSRDAQRARIARLIAPAEARPVGPADVGAQFEALEDIMDLVEREAQQGPVLVAVEDLHWADSSTVLTFLWMMRRLSQVPLLLVSTMRTVPRPGELELAIDEVLRSGATLLRLVALDNADVAALAQRELGLPPTDDLLGALRRAGGNPLWIVEMLRSVAQAGDPSSAGARLSRGELPDSLRDSVVRRLRYLPEATGRTLQMAALLGDTFSLVDLATISGRRASDLLADLNDAFEARLLADGKAVVEFRHQLVRDAIYEDMPRTVRTALHRQAARALEAAGAPVAQSAAQLILGATSGDMEAVSSLRRAARAVVGSAPGVAVNLLREAARLVADHPAQRDLVLVELVGALQDEGQVSESAAIAEELLARGHDRAVDGPLRFKLIQLLSIQGRTEDLNRQVGIALSRAPDMPLADQAAILGHSAYGNIFAGDLHGGEAAARRGLELAERSGDAAIIVWILGGLATAARMCGRHAESLALTERAVRLAREFPEDFARMGNPHFIRGMALCDADLMDEAALAFRDAAAESLRPEQAWVLPDVQLATAELRFLLGEWEEALPELEGGIQFARERGNLAALAKARGYLAFAALARGDQTAAREALGTAEAIHALERPGFFGAIVVYARAVLVEQSEQPAAALELLLAAWRDQTLRDNRHFERWLAPALVRLALDLGHTGVAREVTDRAEQSVGLAPGVASVNGAALRCLGLLHGDADLMLRAVELAAVSRRVLDHAATCEDAAEVLAAHQRTAEARSLLDAAIDSYEGIGATAFALRAGARLRRLGGRRGARGSRARALSGWDSLSISERAVAQLVAEGLTNREIAARLFISPHTVNTHLRHTFQKLDVPTRAGLASRITRSSDVSAPISVQTPG